MPHNTHRRTTNTDKVRVTDWPGYGAQRNRAYVHRTRESVLSIDADEVVTPELRDEIDPVLKTPPRLDKHAALSALGQTNGADHAGLH